MRRLLPIFIVLFSFPILNGQSTTEDLNQALQLICDSPEAEPMFQADTDQGSSMILVYNEVRTGQNIVNISEYLKEIRYELSTTFYGTIVIMSAREYE